MNLQQGVNKIPYFVCAEGGITYATSDENEAIREYDKLVLAGCNPVLLNYGLIAREEG